MRRISCGSNALRYALPSIKFRHLTEGVQKTTGTKIFAQCKLRMPTLQEDFVLKRGPKALEMETSMSEIVHQGDRLVALEVVARSELPSRLPFNRQPLKLTK